MLPQLLVVRRAAAAPRPSSATARCNNRSHARLPCWKPVTARRWLLRGPFLNPRDRLSAHSCATRAASAFPYVGTIRTSVRCSAASGDGDGGGAGSIPGGGGGGPLISASRDRSNGAAVKMDTVRTWLGTPADGAVERLSVVCAHCNAKLVPKEMDYECKMEKLAVGLRPVFRPLARDAATDDFLMRSSRRPWAVNWAMSAACTYLRKFMSLTDANAILGRGRMHVLSQEQAADLMRESLEASLDRSETPSGDVDGPHLVDGGGDIGDQKNNLGGGGGSFCTIVRSLFRERT